MAAASYTQFGGRETTLVESMTSDKKLTPHFLKLNEPYFQNGHATKIKGGSTERIGRANFPQKIVVFIFWW